MANMLRVELTLDELEILIRGLEQSEIPGIIGIRDNLATKYLAKTAAFKAFSSSVLEMIIKAISILTGRPQSSIGPSSELEDLGLTPTKRSQLRAHLNQYIKRQGSNSFITNAEMDAAVTVQDLVVLVETKTP